MVSDNIPPECAFSARASTSAHLLHKQNNLRKLLGRLPHPRVLDDQDIHKCPVASRMFKDESPTQEQIDLVRTSWERVTEIRLPQDDRNISASHAFGLAFYDALFEMDNQVQDLFDNVFQQARALTGMISYIARAPTISGAEGCTIRDINARKSNDEAFQEGDPERLAKQMRDLGARHYFYKVQPHHLELVGPAFVSALKKRLGDEYTHEIGDAWVKANSYVAFNMKIGFESQRVWEEEGRAYKTTRKHKGACTIQ
jgi:hemoglobin-like flavoprotein